MQTRRFLHLVLVFALVLSHALRAQAPASGIRSYTVGVLSDNYPYAYVPVSDTEPVGFAVELFQAIKRISPFELKTVVGTTTEIHAKFLAGELDMLLSYAYSEERAQQIGFSNPYLNMKGEVFVRTDMVGLKSINDLKGLRVMVHPNSLGERVLRETGLADSIVYAESVNDALQRVSEGEGDATLASLLSGGSIADRDRLNLKTARIHVPGYDVRYCFATQMDQVDLVTSLNEALAVIHRSGEFERIYQKWFGRIEPRRFTPVQVLLAICIGLLVALLVAIVAAIRQRRLRRELAQTYDALEQSKDHYYTVFDATPVGLIVAECVEAAGTPRLALREANVTATKLLGLKAHQNTSSDLSVTSPRFRALWTAALSVRPNTSPKRSNIEIEPGEDSDAQTIHLRWSAVREQSRILLVIEDTSLQVAAAKELRIAEETLMQSQKLEALGNLSSGIAHDFNNVLTSIMGNTEMLLIETPVNSSSHEMLRNIRNGSLRARDLVKQILAFSRQMPPGRKSLDLNKIITETVDLARVGVPRAIRLQTTFRNTSTTVMADGTQIHQVLLNLITNSAQAIGERPGNIDISVTSQTVRGTLGTRSPFGLEPNHYHVITVADDGPGMTKEVISRAIEPFYTTKKGSQGTGLGLSVAHGIVSQHGGILRLASEVGQGTRVEVWLPQCFQTESNEELDLVAVGPIATDSPPVLVIDDETIAADALARMLDRLGCAPEIFYNPLDAMAAFRADPARYRAVLCDLSMPELNGLQVLREVIALAPNMPTLLMTGFWSNGSRDKARALGVRILTEKPISLAELHGHMTALLATRPLG